MAKPKKAPKTEPNTISDFEILTVATERRQVEQAEAALAEHKKRLKEAEANLTAKLSGPHTFDGDLRAQLNVSTNTVEGKFSPSYKELWVGHMVGEHKYDEAMLDAAARAAYPVVNKTVTTTELVLVFPEQK